MWNAYLELLILLLLIHGEGVANHMIFRKKKQPWWTVPFVVTAAIYGLIQAELHTRFMWNTIIKRTAFEKLLEFLDKKFPPRADKEQRQPANRSSM